jgi:hypothetical protein
MVESPQQCGAHVAACARRTTRKTDEAAAAPAAVARYQVAQPSVRRWPNPVPRRGGVATGPSELWGPGFGIGDSEFAAQKPALAAFTNHESLIPNPGPK